jgi:hypothetical protein
MVMCMHYRLRLYKFILPVHLSIDEICSSRHPFQETYSQGKSEAPHHTSVEHVHPNIIFEVSGTTTTTTQIERIISLTRTHPQNMNPHPLSTPKSKPVPPNFPPGPLTRPLPAIATHQYTPRDLLELPLKYNQRVLILEAKGEWWFVCREVGREGKDGWVSTLTL